MFEIMQKNENLFPEIFTGKNMSFGFTVQEMLDRNVPAIVVRILIFNYEKQVAWVKWGNTLSWHFSVKNGTKQGAMGAQFTAICIWMTC